MSKRNKINSVSYVARARFLAFGGHRLFDFCNTIIRHGKRDEDRLPEPSEAQRFLRQTYNQTVKLSESEFRELIALRAHLREFFRNVIEGHDLRPSKFMLWLQKHPFMIDPLIGFEKIPLRVSLKRDRFIELILMDLIEVMSSHDKKRIKRCGNPNCSHFFYDSTKPNSRNWCSMKSCGNIMKARAFYERKKLLT